jgi:hypothetical protein
MRARKDGMAAQSKTRTSKAKVIGAVPRSNGFWFVRLKVPHLPFYLDSSMTYGTLEEAEAEAEKWRKRKVRVTVTK